MRDHQLGHGSILPTQDTASNLSLPTDQPSPKGWYNLGGTGIFPLRNPLDEGGGG